MVRRQPKAREALEITNANTAWISSELSKLISEWEEWQTNVEQIVDQPYDKNTQSEVFADGEDMMERHEILQMKTRTFLDNNIAGHWFISGPDGKHSDATTLRLHHRVKHRLRDLRQLEASLAYARVPKGFWQEKAKELVEKVADKAPDAAIQIAQSYLKNPLAASD